ncbi:MAG: hypothetical protein KAI96_07535 [Thermodesulfovibrionia bacterium]|nr:hypothetical protein [Thermodesulfovibrionia bacterium]
MSKTVKYSSLKLPAAGLFVDASLPRYVVATRTETLTERRGTCLPAGKPDCHA